MQLQQPRVRLGFPWGRTPLVLRRGRRRRRIGPPVCGESRHKGSPRPVSEGLRNVVAPAKVHFVRRLAQLRVRESWTEAFANCRGTCELRTLLGSVKPRL